MDSHIERRLAALGLADASPSSSPEEANSVSLQEHGQEDPLWEEFLEFMDEAANDNPYPQHLYRAHVHGYPFVRFWSYPKRAFCDSFASDFHSGRQFKTMTEINESVAKNCEASTEYILETLKNHLLKTQLNRNSLKYRSHMISLSGELRWTTHRLCEVGHKVNSHHIPGLAVFSVPAIRESDVKIWRVKDMLDFLDKTESRHSVRILEYVREWPRNADEYVCWNLIPKAALLSFSPLSDLLEPAGDRKASIITDAFKNSTSLADLPTFGTGENTALEEYCKRIEAFIRTIAIDNLCSAPAADNFLQELTSYFRDERLWGYTAFFDDDEPELIAGLAAIVSAIEEAILEAIDKCSA